MKTQYKEIAFKPETRALINYLNQLIESYLERGYRLSVRQLYYQLVQRNIIKNKESEYKRVAGIINDARLAGMMRWDAIEDRNREVLTRPHWNDGKHFLESVVPQFHLDMWDNQPTRVFVIVEKAALEGVLTPICRKWDVPLLSARGYPSVSILYDMAQDYMIPAIDNGQSIHVLHLGDHDPSGIDMTRDLEERLIMFITGQEFDENEYPAEFTLDRIALSREQIRETNAPPNPAKMSDSRSNAYVKRFGNSSWELDALPPEYIADLVETHLEANIDDERWEERKAVKDGIAAQLKSVVTNFKEQP
ncbi:hypothetical protein D3C87_687490 [compost metagenome]